MPILLGAQETDLKPARQKKFARPYLENIYKKGWWNGSRHRP
jgi:hypothetical protein